MSACPFGFSAAEGTTLVYCQGFSLFPIPGFSQKPPDPEVGKFNALGGNSQPTGGWKRDGGGGWRRDGGQTPQPLFPEGTIWGTSYKAL